LDVNGDADLTMCKLSIIIVNTNTRELVCQCLASLRQNPPQCPVEVIVVDNASTDGSCEEIESKFPSVQVIRNPSNLGFCGANNRGLELARGQLLVLLNSDTLVTAGSLDRMCEAAELDEHIGIVTPMLVYPDGSLQLSYAPIPNLVGVFCSLFDVKRLVPSSALKWLGRARWRGLLGRNVSSYLSWFSGTKPTTKILGQNLYAGGACLLIRRQCFQDVGFLDPNIFMYSDDADYCQRVHDKGWKILYLADATIVHVKGGTVGQRYRWTSPRAYESLLYFFRKHRGGASFQVARCFVLLSLFLRWMIAVTGSRENAVASWNLLRQVARHVPCI
jgi:N-acetylglucosaminyl-diphospho-decaprenol L-rhamnosyltransferase